MSRLWQEAMLCSTHSRDVTGNCPTPTHRVSGGTAQLSRHVCLQRVCCRHSTPDMLLSGAGDCLALMTILSTLCEWSSATCSGPCASLNQQEATHMHVAVPHFSACTSQHSSCTATCMCKSHPAVPGALRLARLYCCPSVIIQRPALCASSAVAWVSSRPRPHASCALHVRLTDSVGRLHDQLVATINCSCSMDRWPYAAVRPQVSPMTDIHMHD